MKTLKRLLAMLLVLALTMSNLPAAALASELTEPEVQETVAVETAVQETAAPSEEAAEEPAPEEEAAEAPEETAEGAEETEAPEETVEATMEEAESAAVPASDDLYSPAFTFHSSYPVSYYNKITEFEADPDEENVFYLRYYPAPWVDSGLADTVPGTFVSRYPDHCTWELVYETQYESVYKITLNELGNERVAGMGIGESWEFIVWHDGIVYWLQNGIQMQKQFNAAGHLYITNKDATDTAVTPPILPADREHPAYLTCVWLNDDGQGFYPQENAYDGFRVMPGQQVHMMFLLNYWNGETYVSTPTYVKAAEGDLNLELMGNENAAPGQSAAGYFYRITTGTWDQQVHIVAADDESIGGVIGHTDRNEVCVYTSPDMSNQSCLVGPYVYDLSRGNDNELYVGFDNDDWSNVTFEMDYNWMAIQDTDDPNVKRLYVNGDTERLLAQGHEDYFAIKATATGRNGETGEFYVNFSMIADPDSIPHDPYLSYGWVGRWEEGLALSEKTSFNYMGAFMPGMENSLCFVLNTWDEDAGRFVQTPVIPQNDHGLIIEPVPADRIAPNQEFAAGFVYLINPGIWDTEVPLYVVLEDGTRAEGVTVNTNRGEMCAYASTELTNENVIMEFVADYNRDDNHFYIALTNDWAIPAGELYVAHEQYAPFFDIEKVTDKLYKVTLTREYLEQIRAQGGEDIYGGFQIDVQVEDTTWNTGLSYGLWLRLDPSTVPHDPYLTFGWLDNWGEGFFDLGEWHENQGFNICPGEEFFQIYFLNLWDEERQEFVKHPVTPSQLESSGLDFAQVEDVREDQTNKTYFSKVTAKESAFQEDVEIYVMHEGKKVSFYATVDLHRVDFYKTPDIHYSNRLMEPLEIDPDGENVVYLGINDKADFVAYDVSLVEECQGFAQIQKLSDNVWKLTATQEAIDQTINGYILGVGLRVSFRHKSDPNWTEEEWQQFELSRMALETKGRFDLNHERYEILDNGYIRNYPTGEFDEWGDEIWAAQITQLPEGLSYDYETNTLTMDNYHGESFMVNYRDFDWENNHEILNLPTDTLTIRLVGKNSLISQRDAAMGFEGDLNVVFTGDGSLHIKATNRPDFLGDNGEPVNFCAMWAGRGSLTFKENAQVTVEIAGTARQTCWDENGQPMGTRPSHLTALNMDRTAIFLQDNAVLTTVVPEGARANGDKLPENDPQIFWEDRYPGGYAGIQGIRELIVSGGTLNTSELWLNRHWNEDESWTGSTFRMTGGTVNIEALGYNEIRDNWEWNEELQQDVLVESFDSVYYEGICIDADSKVRISGGTLNVDVNPEMPYEEMPAHFSGIRAWGADIVVAGGQINVIPGYEGIMLNLQTAWMEEVYPTTFAMSGGELNLDGKDDCRVIAMDLNPESTFTFTGGTIEASQADFRMGGNVTIDGGTLRGVNLDYYSDNTFKFDSGLISLQEESSIMMGTGEMNGGTMDLNRTGVFVHGGFQMNGGEIRIVNKGEEIFWPALIVDTYMAMSNDAKLVLEHSALSPAMEVRGTFHQMDNSTVTIDHYSYAGEAAVFVPGIEERFGTLLLNDGTFTIQGLDGQQIKGLRMDQTSVAEFGQGDILLTNADVEFSGKVVMHDNTFTMDGGTVFVQTPGEVILENADFRLVTNLEEKPDPEEWYIAFLASVDTMFTVNGGSLSIDSKGYDCAFDLCGDYTQTGGTVTAKGDNIAMAVKGISDISGGTLNLTGELGYNHNYIPDITTNSKLMFSGGTMNIDAKRIGMGVDSTTEITGGQIDVKVSGYELDVPELGKVCVGLGIVMDSAAGGNPKLVISGGKMNVDVPQDADGYEIKNLYGILAFDSKVEILGGELELKARNVLAIESADKNDMLLLGETLAAISQTTGKRLYPLVDTLYLDENGQLVAPGKETEIRYYGCFEEDNQPSAGDLVEEIDYVKHLVILAGQPITDVALEADAQQLAPGQSAIVSAITPDPNAQLVWSLGDGDQTYVTLKENPDNTVTITAKKNKVLRDVTVTVSLAGSGESASLVLTVLPTASKVQIRDLAGNELTGKTVTYYMGTGYNMLPLVAEVVPEEASQAVTWKSSDEKLATVDETGLVTMLVPGKTVTITASAADGSGRKATVKIKTVLALQQINLPESGACAVGKTITLKPELLPENATDNKVVWEIVEGKKFATISNGKLKGVAPGEAVVRVSAQWNRDIYAECRVQIYPAVQQVDILLDGQIVTKKILDLFMSTQGDNTLQLYAENTPDGSFQDVTWKSSNVKFATVDETGLVTALVPGKTITITATATDGSGRKASVKIKTEQPVEELTITGSDVAAAGKTIALGADIYPAEATNKRVSWSIVEGSEYASINSSGKLKVNKNIQDGQTVTVRLDWTGNTEDYEITHERVITLYAAAATAVDIVDTEGSSITKQLVLAMSGDGDNTVELDAVVKTDKAAQEVLWKSSNEKYALVDEDGTVKLLVPDKPVTITATAADGSGKKDSVKIKGVQPVEDLLLKEGGLTDSEGKLFVAAGKSVKLAPSVEIVPAVVSNKKLIWSVESNDYGIKISSSGVLSTNAKKVTEKVTAVVTVAAADGSGSELTFDVNVYPATKGIDLLVMDKPVTGMTITAHAGSTFEITAESTNAGAANVYTWKSSNVKYATVDENGVVTLSDCIGKTVTITATAADGSNKKVTVKIKIVEAPQVVLPDQKAEAEAEIRRAVSLLIDREAASFGQLPASSFVPMGMSDTNGRQFYQNAGGNSYPGYWNATAYEANCAEAMKILSKYYEVDKNGKLVGFPELTYIYNESTGHKAIAEVIQQNLRKYGIRINLQEMDWNLMLNTRQEGNYDIARNGWLSDYNDPISMLDTWTTYSGNNDVQFGRDAHAAVAIYDLDLTPWGYDIQVENGTWAQTYDVLIQTIKSCQDEADRYEMMHLAEDMLMETGCILPLYYYTDNYLLDSSVTGFGSSPMGVKFFHKTKVSGKQDQISVNLMAEDDILDPAMISSVDASSMMAHLFAGLAKLAPDASGRYTRVVADCAEELVKPVLNRDGTATYTYTLKQGLTWSDGVELTAHDFEFAWKRAADPETGAAYGYMFEQIKGYPDNLAVTATDDRTLTVTLSSNVPYWNELLAFSTFMPVREDVVANENWSFSAETYVSNGAYTMSDWEHGSVITLQKNSSYHDAANVTMNTIRVISYGDIQKLWKDGQLQYVESEFEGMDRYGKEFVVDSALGTYYANFNVNTQLLP